MDLIKEITIQEHINVIMCLVGKINVIVKGQEEYDTEHFHAARSAIISSQYFRLTAFSSNSRDLAISSKKKAWNLLQSFDIMGTETKKGEAETKDFKPYLTSQDVVAALEQRHVDLLIQSKLPESSCSSHHMQH